MLLRGFATADASSLIEEAAFFEDLFLSNRRFDAGNHFYDNAVLRPSDFLDARNLPQCPNGRICRIGFYRVIFLSQKG